MKENTHLKSKDPTSAPNAELVTIDMVARAAGVSPSTVSRIINGTTAVSQAKTAAVKAAIATLGFVPNPVARGLAGGRTLSIGVVTQSLDSPFYGAALQGIEIELHKYGYSPLFVSGQWNEHEERRCVAVLRARRVDGIILIDARLSDEALIALSKEFAVVATGRSLTAPNLFSLRFDNFQGALEATEHLIALGHRRIAFITGADDHQDALERMRGYVHALKAHGISIDPNLIIPGDYSERSGAEAIDHLIDSKTDFTSVFSANDQMALGAMLSLYRHNLAVPAQVSVIGFDDIHFGSFMIPPLTSIHQPSGELGQLAARAVLDLLAGEYPVVKLPVPYLVVRESTTQRKKKA